MMSKVGKRELVHPREKPYDCKHCGKYFNNIGNLKKHLRVHTGVKPYECKQCGKCFKQAAQLKNHVRVHTGEKCYECKQCRKCFKWAVGLRNHVKVHLSEKLCKCKQGMKCVCQGGHLMTLASTEEIHAQFSYTQSEKNYSSHDITKSVNCSIQPVVNGSYCDLKSDTSTVTSNIQELELCNVECWICQEELCSQAQLLKHYDNHMK